MSSSSSKPVLRTSAYGHPWESVGPFILTGHHVDLYPRGDGHLGPGHPRSGDDRWSMYHGTDVPGFPAHPHRGFETVTYVRRGLVDHADSAGGAARYGHGDVQWLTAAAGLQHGEMLPLVDTENDNPLEMFQMWLNLPAEDKSAPPDLKMLWAEEIPHVRASGIDVTVIAGAIGDVRALEPTRRSWASRPGTDVAIWHLQLEPGARWTVPPADEPASVRALFVVEGEDLAVGDAVSVGRGARVDLRPDAAAALGAGPRQIEALMLQGVPIGESLAVRGPFVMNTEAELDAAYREFRATQFGGWPWPSTAQTHGAEPSRFVRTADGSTERPPSTSAA